MTSPRKNQAIAIQVSRNFAGVRVTLPKLRKLATIICTRFGNLKRPEATYEISIAIVDDAEMTQLNARFLGRACTTDCLSFDLSGPGQKTGVGLAAADLRARTFELIVNGEMAVRQAASRGHSAQAELLLYIAHGLLHNFGFDDHTPGQARKMHQAEDRILQELGYGLVYNTDTDAPER